MSNAPVCSECGTDHNGHIPGSLGAEMWCLRFRALRTLSEHAALDFDKSWQRVRTALDEKSSDAIRRYFSESEDQ